MNHIRLPQHVVNWIERRWTTRFAQMLETGNVWAPRLPAPVSVGRLVLDRMPDNFFAETEQVAFMTQNVHRKSRSLVRGALSSKEIRAS